MAQDNEEVKSTLLEGNTRFSSAATVMGNVKTELETLLANLNWQGPVDKSAKDAYTQVHTQFATDAGMAQDILQKCAGALKSLHDAIVEAEEKAKQAKEQQDTEEVLILGVLIFAQAVEVLVTPLLVAADEAAAAALETVETEVMQLPDVLQDVETVNALPAVDDVTTLPVNDIPLPDAPPTVNTPPAGASPVDAPDVPPPSAPPVDPPTTPAGGTPDAPDVPPPNTPEGQPPNMPEGQPPSTSEGQPPNTPEGQPPNTPEETPPAGNDTPGAGAEKRDSGVDFGTTEEPGKFADSPANELPKEIGPQEPVTVNVMTMEDGLGITMDTNDLPPQATVTVVPHEETFVDPVTGNTTVVKIDTAGNQTTTVTDPAGNVTITEPDPLTGNPQTTEIFTDPQGNTTVTNSTIQVDRLNGNVFETDTVIHPDGSQTITQTVTQPDGTLYEDVFQPDGTWIHTETKPDGTTVSWEYKTDGTKTTKWTEPNGSKVSVEDRPDGSKVTTEDRPNGEKVVKEVKTVNDPQTGKPTQIETMTGSGTDAQGQPIEIKTTTDPIAGTKTITNTVTHSDGSQTVTTTVTDQSGQNILSQNTYTVPSTGPGAGPSTDPIAGPSTGPGAGVAKRPPPEPESPPDPSDPKGKKVKR